MALDVNVIKTTSGNINVNVTNGDMGYNALASASASNNDSREFLAGTGTGSRWDDRATGRNEDGPSSGDVDAESAQIAARWPRAFDSARQAGMREMGELPEAYFAVRIVRNSTG